MKKRIVNVVFEIKKKYNNIVNFPEIKRRQYQDKQYLVNDIKREVCIKELNKVLKDMGKEDYCEKNSMYSEHLVLMMAISLKRQDIKNILEIGTYDGVTAEIMAKLFPNAKIKTIDLEKGCAEFVNTYERQDTVIKFIEERNTRISKYQNIIFEEKNSMELISEKAEYDLIWLDGAHGFPIVTLDMCNSLRLLSKNGILLSDDIIKDKYILEDGIYTSTKGYQTLEMYENAGIAKTNYFLKRLEDKHMKIIKYVGMTKLQ